MLTPRLVIYHVGNNADTLGTTLRDRGIHSLGELSKRYHERWGIEELYKVSKALIEVQDFHGKSERGSNKNYKLILSLSR